jgi:hypothetical protein
MAKRRSARQGKGPVSSNSPDQRNQQRQSLATDPSEAPGNPDSGSGSSDQTTRSKRRKAALVVITAFATAFAAYLANNLVPGVRSLTEHLFPSASSPAITVNVEPDPGLLDYQSWLFPSNFTASKLSSDYDGVSDWAPSLGGRSAGSMALKVIVTDNIASGVTITGIEAKVVRRTHLGTYALVDNPGQGGGEDRSTVVGLNLDETDPHASLFENGQMGPTAKSLKGAYFSKRTYDLPENATHAFDVVAYASAQDDEWELQIDYVAGGKPESTVVDNNGTPFKLAGFSDRTKFTAIYMPRYIAKGGNADGTWADIGRSLCPSFPFSFGDCKS